MEARQSRDYQLRLVRAARVVPEVVDKPLMRSPGVGCRLWGERLLWW